MLDHTTFQTRDYWGAAFLHVNGCELLRAESCPDGRTNFIFANTADQAYRFFLDWKAANGRDLVPLQTYRQSYRFIQDAAHQAKEDQHHDHSTDN